MSDSVKGAEVEDVLSSVRRLISNDRRRRRPAPDPAEDAADEDGRLLLTPSDRVAEATEAAPTYEDPVIFDEHGGSLEDRIAELEAAISERSDDWEPDGSEDQAENRPTTMVVSRNGDGGVGANRPLRLSRISLITPDMRADRDHSEDTAASVVEVSDPDAGSPPTEVSSQAADPASINDDIAQDADPVTNDGVDADAGFDAALAEDDGDFEGDLEANSENPVWVADEIAEDDPDTSAADPENTEATAPAEVDLPTIEDADVVEVDPDDFEEDRRERREPRKTAERVRELYADEMEDTLLDDEALRDLVSALIRDELQGELGERITRNVRKLVRREIQRALAARDLH